MPKNAQTTTQLHSSHTLVKGNAQNSPSQASKIHAKMGSIKDRNGMDLMEAEDIKKRWKEYTEELYKKKKSS